MNGLVCAGKKIHEILLDVGNVGVRDIAAKYVQECQLMSDLRHPNITLFLGLCFLPNCQLPVLVMERLDGSLDDLLETVPNIPLPLKCSMLEDVARGLLYLHKHDPQIIHRDLTAKNVLLTSSLVAKITDLGNSRIVNIQPGQLAQTLSRNPGTLVYMPPEALTAAARYGPSLDIFSFGHLGIFVGLQVSDNGLYQCGHYHKPIQVFPGDLLEPTYTDPEHQGRLLARSEEERRGQYIEQLDYQLPRSQNEQHPFVQLVKRCLKNEPSDRPTAQEMITALEDMKADIDGPYGEVARADAVRQVVMMRTLKRRETEVREKTDESAAKDEEIHCLQLELEHEQVGLLNRLHISNTVAIPG